MDWSPVVSAVAGGIVGIAGSFAGATVTLRHARQTRWDSEQAAALGDLVETAARLEGRHFRRALSASRAEGHDLARERQDLCEQDYDLLFAKSARIRALLPEVSPRLDAVFDAERELRAIADEGLGEYPAEDPHGWRPARDRYRDAMAALTTAAARALRTG